MRASEHPAARPPSQRPRPYTAEDEPHPETRPVYRAADDSDLPKEPEPAEPTEPPAQEPGEPEPAPAPQQEPEPAPEPSLAFWDGIGTAPRDGTFVAIRYAEDDETGRLAHWKHGRKFEGGRWREGGRWVPSDSMEPLPAEAPIQWLRLPDPEPASEEAA